MRWTRKILEARGRRSRNPIHRPNVPHRLRTVADRNYGELRMLRFIFPRPKNYFFPISFRISCSRFFSPIISNILRDNRVCVPTKSFIDVNTSASRGTQYTIGSFRWFDCICFECFSLRSVFARCFGGVESFPVAKFQLEFRVSHLARHIFPASAFAFSYNSFDSVAKMHCTIFYSHREKSNGFFFPVVEHCSELRICSSCTHHYDDEKKNTFHSEKFRMHNWPKI